MSRSRPLRTLLMRPPLTIYEQGFEKRIGVPIGIFSIAAALEQRGRQVSLFDAQVYDDSRDPQTWGASVDRMRRAVEDASPDVVGITNQFSQQRHNALALAKLVKDLNPGLKVLIGGPHASARPQDFLDTGLFDLAVVGEGEETLLDILDMFEGRTSRETISGIAYKDDGTLRVQPPRFIADLDSLPLPAYHLVDMERYFDLSVRGIGTRPSDPFESPQRDISIITSRGCPFNCIFCSIHSSMGKKWRGNTPEYVLRHVRYLIDRYGVRLFHFEDDNLTFNKQRFQAICRELASLPLEWDMPNGIRADTLDRETLQLMKAAHVKEVRIAIESGSQRVLDQVIQKHLSLRSALAVCREAHGLGVPVSSFYVIGLPGETRPELEKTLDLARLLMSGFNVFPHVNIANPLEGTPLHDICLERDYLVQVEDRDKTLPYRGKIATEEFTAEDVERMFARFHRRVAFLYVLQFFKNPRATLQKLVNLIRHPQNTATLVRTVVELMK